MTSYSVDAIKRRVFEDELQNVINILDVVEMDEIMCNVQEYLENRIKEIDKQYGNEYNGQER